MTDSQSPDTVPRLNRREHGRPVAPERIIHLGVGNFTRAHQSWYTEHAPDAKGWGIAAFTGHGDHLVKSLEAQGCVYTLITSAPQGDHFEVVSSLSSVHSGFDITALRQRFADPSVAIMTSTVTEAGYMRDQHGDLDLGDAHVAADLQALRADKRADTLFTTPARVVSGLLARREADAGPIAILPCDNLAGNGAAFRTVVEQAISQVDPTLLGWTSRNVSWTTSMVDRITPATTDQDREAVIENQRRLDECPVRTEPFAEWVISGDFPAGRPVWEDSGATLTDDVTPYEQRKLWMLNGAHSLLAYAGLLFGYENVSEAIADSTLRQSVSDWWDLVAPYLAIRSEEYRIKLTERFSNPRIHHQLMQIATDGSQKIPVRIIPVAKLALADGRSIVPAARALASWILFIRRFASRGLADVNRGKIVALATAGGQDAARNVVSYLDTELGASTLFIDEVDYELKKGVQDITRMFE